MVELDLVSAESGIVEVDLDVLGIGSGTTVLELWAVEIELTPVAAASGTDAVVSGIGVVVADLNAEDCCFSIEEEGLVEEISVDVVTVTCGSSTKFESESMSMDSSADERV